MYLNASARTWQSQYTLPSSVLDFHKRLPDYAETPLRELPIQLSKQLCTGPIFFKDESIRFGLPAFKILGASWACYGAVTALLNLPLVAEFHEVMKAALKIKITIYAATDGNFGRAVARMAKVLGCQARIYVPMIMAEETKRLIGIEGAEVVVVQGDYDAAVVAAAQGAKVKGGLLVQDDAWPGFEDIPKLVAEGYSTMMLEVDQQLGRAPDMVVVPVGVGSLAQAVVAHYKAFDPSPLILTVEPDTAACLNSSLKNDNLTTIETGDTTMCGMNCGTVSSLAWPILRNGVDASTTVTDAEAESAMRMLKEMGIKTGPCSAGTLAGLIKVSKSHDKLRLNDMERGLVVVLGTEGPR